MATATILNHNSTAQALASMEAVSPASGAGGDSSSTSSSDSATISANDFLTLLVTEMQNQDPTANTDPNEYIDQLVQVNSLEQLININQTLSTALTAPSTSSSSNGAAATQALASTAGPVTPGVSAADVAKPTAAKSSSLTQAPGNLSIPNASAASQRVAHALDGQSHTPAVGSSFPGGVI
jgi:flagellar basal-body rod modification protein FlgD